MSEKCSKLFAKLSFDNPEMEGSLADKYFKHNKHIFGLPNEVSVTDTCGNTIFSSKFENKNFKGWATSPEYRQNFFIKLGTEIMKTIELITEIEYYVRGVPIPETKQHLCKLVEACEVIADSTPLMPNTWDVTEEVDAVKYSLKNTNSIVELLDVLHSLAATIPVCVFADSNTGVLVHCFKTLLKACDTNGYLPSVGPYFDSSADTFDLHEGSSMIVYNGGDLDSAAEAVVRGAWSYNGYLPHALRRVFVQDSAWELFVNKLSLQVKQFMWKYPSNYKPDKSTLQVIKNVNDIYNKTKIIGQDTLKMNDFFSEAENNDTFLKPLVLLDDEPYFWQNLNKQLPTPLVTLQAFRTSKEALLLFNKVPTDNLSIWCNDISLCNEIATRVDVERMWINEFGLYNPRVSTVQSIYYKLSLKWIMPEPIHTKLSNMKFTALEEQTALKKISKVQTQWLTWSKEKRLAALLKVANYFEENESKFMSKIDESQGIEVSSKSYKDGIEQIRQVVSTWSVSNDVYMGDNHMCVKIRKPLGTVYFWNKNYRFDATLAAIAGAALFGNVVLCETRDDYSFEIVESFLKFSIPVVAIDKISDRNAIRTFMLHPVLNDFNFASNVFTKSKHVWYMYGESFYDTKMLDVTHF